MPGVACLVEICRLYFEPVQAAGHRVQVFCNAFTLLCVPHNNVLAHIACITPRGGGGGFTLSLNKLMAAAAVHHAMHMAWIVHAHPTRPMLSIISMDSNVCTSQGLGLIQVLLKPANQEGPSGHDRLSLICSSERLHSSW